MPRIAVETDVQATPERCFDLSRDLDLHQRSLAHTGERAVAGKTSGLIGLGEEVTWRGRHFGIVHEHTSRITAYDRPRHFRDEMTRGRFKCFRHDHYFIPQGEWTRISDVLEFESPFGLVGRVVDFLVMKSYLMRLLQTRNAVVKHAAETDVES